MYSNALSPFAEHKSFVVQSLKIPKAEMNRTQRNNETQKFTKMQNTIRNSYIREYIVTIWLSKTHKCTHSLMFGVKVYKNFTCSFILCSAGSRVNSAQSDSVLQVTAVKLMIHYGQCKQIVSWWWKKMDLHTSRANHDMSPAFKKHSLTHIKDFKSSARL